MKNLIATTFTLFTLCVLNSHAQSGAGGQPVPASRDAVMSTSAEAVPADSTAIQMSSRRDATTDAPGATEVPAENSGQPATSVRKPD
jgi:hypothetical protein